MGVNAYVFAAIIVVATIVVRVAAFARKAARAADPDTCSWLAFEGRRKYLEPYVLTTDVDGRVDALLVIGLLIVNPAGLAC